MANSAEVGQIPALPDLLAERARSVRVLSFMSGVVANNAEGLFERKLESIRQQEGEISTQLEEVGEQKERLCSVYLLEKIPEVAARINQINHQITSLQTEGDGLIFLAQGGFVSEEDYNSARKEHPDLHLDTYEKVRSILPRRSRERRFLLALQDAYSEQTAVPRSVLERRTGNPGDFHGIKTRASRKLKTVGLKVVDTKGEESEKRYFLEADILKITNAPLEILGGVQKEVEITGEEYSQMIEDRLARLSFNSKYGRIMLQLRSVPPGEVIMSQELVKSIYGEGVPVSKLNSDLFNLRRQIQSVGVKIDTFMAGPRSGYRLAIPGFKLATVERDPYDEKWNIIKSQELRIEAQHVVPNDPYMGKDLFDIQKSICAKVDAMHLSPNLARLFAILSGSVSETMALNTHEIAFALFPDRTVESALSNFEYTKQALRKRLEVEGVYIKVVGGRDVARYYLYDPEASLELLEKIEREVKIPRVNEILDTIKLSAAEQRIVESLKGYVSKRMARDGKEWAQSVFEGLPPDEAFEQLSFRLKRLRRKLQEHSLTIRSERHREETEYYYDFVSDEEQKLPLRRGVQRRVKARDEISEEEQERRALVESIRRTSLGRQRSLLDD